MSNQSPPKRSRPTLIAERSGVGPVLRDLFRRRSAQIGGLIVLSLVLMAIFAPWLAPYEPYAINVRERLLPPSLTHPFGTDDLGRDLFSRVIYGARTTIQTGVVVVAIAASLGSLIGLLSGYYGGMVDLIVMRVIDVMLAFPYILLALAIVATLGPSLQNALIAIGLAYYAWVGTFCARQCAHAQQTGICHPGGPAIGAARGLFAAIFCPIFSPRSSSWPALIFPRPSSPPPR